VYYMAERRYSPLQSRPQLACGEVLQRAKACREFRRRQAALPVERAQKIPRRTVPLTRVASETAGNQAGGRAFNSEKRLWVAYPFAFGL